MAAKEGEGMGDLPWQASLWLFVVRCSLFVVRCSLFVVRCSLFALP